MKINNKRLLSYRQDGEKARKHMKLEELTSITTIERNATIKDCSGRIVGRCNFTDNIPPFLSEVEVDSVDVDADGNVWIDVCFDNNMPFLERVKNMLNGVHEDIEDGYKITTVDEVNKRIKAFAANLEAECHLVTKALDEGELWDYYLD